MVRRIIPSPFHYAVARLKPVKMLQDLGLNDDITLAEARQMDTKKYLIYLYWVCHPDSGIPWGLIEEWAMFLLAIPTAFTR